LTAELSDIAPSVHPELAAHGAIFRRKLHQVAENVFVAVGWSTCNSVMIVGSDGVIIVDAGDSAVAAREVAAEFRKITAKPVRALVYTCFHIDHIAGVKGFVSAADVAAGRVEIIAHESLLANVVNQGATIAPILNQRTAYNFGVGLDAGELEGMNLGTGPLPRKDREVSFIAPTRTFASRLDATVAGVELNLIHAPSEAADEIVVFLPDSGVLLSSEVVPAQCFPVLHPLRGEAYRDPTDWRRSLDLLRGLRPRVLAPAHGPPILGEGDIEEVLVSYRDAIQFVHDQTVRHINRGLTPDELVEAVKLPPHLADAPWMKEYFGTVAQAVRAIYQAHLGWFEGDPVALAPLARAERANREVALMGGRERVLDAAEAALACGDPQWAAELATRLVRTDAGDRRARRLKAAAFRKQGYAQINAIWRNWYLSAARELEQTDEAALRPRGGRAGLAAPELVAALPVAAFVEALPLRLRAEEVLDVTMSATLLFADSAEAYAISIRRGVAQVETGRPAQADIALRMDRPTLNAIRTGALTFAEGVARGSVRLECGEAADVARFFGYFDPPSGPPPRLVVR
jgi:alkyl sulfatase BDS1-like metallo-beta-lactamase superfamily hydrolase